MQVREILSVFVFGALLSACGSSTSTGTSTMSVHLVDAPSSGYAQVNVDVRRVDIRGDSGWVTLGTPNQVVDLLALTGGVTANLVDGATLPAGHYGQMRLVLGPNNTVKLLDGTVAPLTVPSGQQTGVKLIVNFDVQPGTTSDVYIDFDAHRSIFVHEAGASGKYMLRPTVRAFAKLETGSISGTLTVAGSTTPIPGVEVTAQTVTAGVPAVVRATRTDAAGHYVLDLLPRDGTYFVVSQPVTRDALGLPLVSYEPAASAPFLLTAMAPVRTYDASFTAAAAVGAISGSITPVATVDQADSLDVRLPLAVGAGTQSFVVRNAGGVVATGAETWGVTALPTVTAGRAYTIAATRVTVDATGGETTTLAPSVTATVMPGATATANVTFP